MSQLTLVSHHLCPYVQRAAIALVEKGVAFDPLYVDLAAKPDWFVALSPLGKVPLLKVSIGEREAVLFESSAICEYVEDTQPGPKLHPREPLDRALHRGWMEFGSAILSDLWTFETTSDADAFEVKRKALVNKFARVESALHDGPYFAGERFSLVDAVFAPIFRYFDVFDTIGDTGVFAGTPKVRAWRAALTSRPSVIAAAVPDYADRLRAFLVRHDAFILRSTSPDHVAS